MTWLQEFWPLVPFLAGIAFGVGYELYALVTRIPGIRLKRVPTISQLVWRGYDDFPGLVWIVTPAVVALWTHFFVRRRDRS